MPTVRDLVKKPSELVEAASADLVIRKVAVESNVMPPQIDVTIKNRGSREAVTTRTAMIYVGDQGVAGVGTRQTPAIPAGGEATIHFSEPVHHAGFLIFLLDAPWGTGTEFGKIQEQPTPLLTYMSPRELNNVLLVPFKPGHEPHEYTNPAAK